MKYPKHNSPVIDQPDADVSSTSGTLPNAPALQLSMLIFAAASSTGISRENSYSEPCVTQFADSAPWQCLTPTDYFCSSLGTTACDDPEENLTITKLDVDDRTFFQRLFATYELEPSRVREADDSILFEFQRSSPVSVEIYDDVTIIVIIDRGDFDDFYELKRSDARLIVKLVRDGEV
jgi:hypothetical protein